MRGFMCAVVLAAALGLSLQSCHKADQRKEAASMPDTSLAADIGLIKESRIYFGHRSVGNNILRGVYDLVTDSAGRPGVTFLALSDSSDVPEHFFADAMIGENTRPDTKCEAFAQSIDHFKGALPEVAFMKFCFIDFGQGMSAEEIFALYTRTIDSLKKKYPAVSFIHVTAPLTARQSGLKPLIKKILGRGDRFEADNMERNRFNALLRDRYKNEPLFDLARVESTRPDGTTERFRVGDAEYDALVPDYSDDGGHLNEHAQKRAGRELIRVLAETLRTHRKNSHTPLSKS